MLSLSKPHHALASTLNANLCGLNHVFSKRHIPINNILDSNVLNIDQVSFFRLTTPPWCRTTEEVEMNKPPQPITGPSSVPNPAPSPGLTQVKSALYKPNSFYPSLPGTAKCSLLKNTWYESQISCWLPLPVFWIHISRSFQMCCCLWVDFHHSHYLGKSASEKTTETIQGWKKEF